MSSSSKLEMKRIMGKLLLLTSEQKMEVTSLNKFFDLKTEFDFELAPLEPVTRVVHLANP